LKDTPFLFVCRWWLLSTTCNKTQTTIYRAFLDLTSSNAGQVKQYIAVQLARAEIADSMRESGVERIWEGMVKKLVGARIWTKSISFLFHPITIDGDIEQGRLR
jgi:hypothetical protein